MVNAVVERKEVLGMKDVTKERSMESGNIEGEKRKAKRCKYQSKKRRMNSLEAR